MARRLEICNLLNKSHETAPPPRQLNAVGVQLYKMFLQKMLGSFDDTLNVFLLFCKIFAKFDGFILTQPEILCIITTSF